MYSTIHLLRGIAALLVAGFHLKVASESEGFQPQFFEFFKNGQIGVDIFFVISGFVICWSATRKQIWSRGEFLISRFFRIYPVYWFFLAVFLTLSVGLWLATGDTSKLPTLSVAIQSFLLLPSHEYVIDISWTLTIEITFYILFCLSFKGSKSSFFPVFIVMVIWSILSVIRSLNGHDSSFVFTLLHPAVPELLMGVLIARLHMSGVTKFSNLAVVLGGIGLVHALMMGPIEHKDELRALWAGLPAALFIFGTLGWKRKMSKAEVLFGDASYVLYLAHIPIYLVVGFLLEKTLSQNLYSSELLMLMTLVGACLFSAAFHVLVEKRYQNWYKRGPNFNIITSAFRQKRIRDT